MNSGYKKLAIAIAINFVIMYLLTFVLIADASHFNININRIYMALLMAFPMVIIMLLVMRSMFQNKRLNAILLGGSAVLFILVFFLARTQTPVGNVQFLNSMIPHHSSAILMCEESSITDPEIITLCDEIVKTQREEISQMEDIRARLRQ